MSSKIFIDGAEGTTGLQLRQRLLLHPEVKLISINSDKRKDLSCKLEKFSESDLIFLCLPDEESKKTVYDFAKKDYQNVKPVASKKILGKQFPRKQTMNLKKYHKIIKR